MTPEKPLEKLVRKYANFRGLYIPVSEEMKFNEGCFYRPILSEMNPSTLTEQTRLKRLIRWALG